MDLAAWIVILAVFVLFCLLPWYLTWRIVQRRGASRRWPLTMAAGPVMGLGVAHAFVPGANKQQPRPTDGAAEF